MISATPDGVLLLTMKARLDAFRWRNRCRLSSAKRVIAQGGDEGDRPPGARRGHRLVGAFAAGRHAKHPAQHCMPGRGNAGTSTTISVLVEPMTRIRGLDIGVLLAYAQKQAYYNGAGTTAQS